MQRKIIAIVKSRMVLALPLVIACTFLFSQNSYSRRFDKRGNIVTYKGNTFVLGKERLDTFELIDAVTGKKTGSVTKRDPQPEKINGKKIYKLAELTTQPRSFSKDGSITDFVVRKMSDVMNTMPDGKFRLDIHDIVIDAKGKIVFYDGIGLSFGSNDDIYSMSDAIADKIDEALTSVPALKPGVAHGNAVAVLSDISFVDYEIEVKNHQSTFRKVWK